MQFKKNINNSVESHRKEFEKHDSILSSIIHSKRSEHDQRNIEGMSAFLCGSPLKKYQLQTKNSTSTITKRRFHVFSNSHSNNWFSSNSFFLPKSEIKSVVNPSTNVHSLNTSTMSRARIDLLRLINPTALINTKKDEGVIASLADLPGEVLKASTVPKTISNNSCRYKENNDDSVASSSSVISASTCDTLRHRSSRQYVEYIHAASLSSFSEPEVILSGLSPRESSNNNDKMNNNDFNPTVTCLFNRLPNNTSSNYSLNIQAELDQRRRTRVAYNRSSPMSSDNIVKYSTGRNSTGMKFANPSFMRSPEPSDVPFPLNFLVFND